MKTMNTMNGTSARIGISRKFLARLISKESRKASPLQNNLSFCLIVFSRGENDHQDRIYEHI